jgi:hypothetical protein
LDPQKKQRRLANANPADTAHRLHDGIQNTAMAVWGEQLQTFKRQRTAYDDRQNK